MKPTSWWQLWCLFCNLKCILGFWFIYIYAIKVWISAFHNSSWFTPLLLHQPIWFLFYCKISVTSVKSHLLLPESWVRDWSATLLHIKPNCKDNHRIRLSNMWRRGGGERQKTNFSFYWCTSSQWRGSTWTIRCKELYSESLVSCLYLDVTTVKCSNRDPPHTQMTSLNTSTSADPQNSAAALPS